MVLEFGLFEFTRLSYGLVETPVTFQKLSDKFIGPELEPFVFSYLDDINIPTTSSEHYHLVKYRFLAGGEARFTGHTDEVKSSRVVGYECGSL